MKKFGFKFKFISGFIAILLLLNSASIAGSSEDLAAWGVILGGVLLFSASRAMNQPDCPSDDPDTAGYDEEAQCKDDQARERAALNIVMGITAIGIGLGVTVYSLNNDSSGDSQDTANVSLRFQPEYNQDNRLYIRPELQAKWNF